MTTIEATDAEWDAMVEDLCQSRLHHSLSVFRTRWASGEYSWSHDLDAHCDIVSVATLVMTARE